MTNLLQKDYADTLGRFGLALTPKGSLSLHNAHTAATGHLHHTFRPIAAVGWARTDPQLAQDRLGEYSLADFVTKRTAMSDETAEVFATVCGATHVRGPFFWRAEAFFNYLQGFIENYGLQPFYGHFPRQGEWHMGIRPRGFDWDGDEKLIPSEHQRFRSAFMALPEPKRMLVASVLWLYRGDKHDEAWLEGLPRHWSGIDAIAVLEQAGMLASWGELVARYPGW